MKTICPSALILIASASALMAETTVQSGKVQTGGTPIASSTIRLYSAGNARETAASVLGTARSDRTGCFQISFNLPSDSNAVLYLIAEGGSPVRADEYGDSERRRGAVRLATVLGRAPFPASVVINERTTTASAYAMAQFIRGANIGGKWPGLQNAAATVRSLVDLATGDLSPVLANPPNGSTTSTMSAFNSLANLLASCVNASNATPCLSLFRLAAPPNDKAPRDTLQAAVDIAHFPAQNASRLFLLSLHDRLYTPDLLTPPDAWTLAVRYNGNGHELDGPGNMVFDKDGNVWSTNNYQFNSDPHEPVCAGKELIKLTPTGEDAPGAPYSGGGLDGAGFGITIDTRGDVWVGNFGFKGKGCNVEPTSDSVSQFTADGVPLSPDKTGDTEGFISFPQATVSDRSGNIWIANCGGDSVTRYRDGIPDNRNFKNIGVIAPFGLAIDSEGNGWVTGNTSDTVAGLTPDGRQLPGSPFKGGGISAPLSIAVDSLDNVWVANSGGVPIGSVICGSARTPGGTPSVTEIRHGDRKMQAFSGGGIRIPWGIAVDGNDNIWVANFGGQRLTELCGARPSTCPPGHNTGDPISPESGYSSNSLERNTGVAIDPSGNVWLANNWLTVPYQPNPGGHELVVFIGLAAPVKAPLIGPPEQP